MKFLLEKTMKPINIIVGFDQREAVAYHVFCQSVLERASKPVCFIPLAKNTLNFYNETKKDGSNDFIYSRFLTPFICDFKGHAIFADGDMVVNADIVELINQFDPTKAVQVVKHNYQTKAKVKYLGNKNENYPRKNWSSLILWNCSHEANKILTPEFIQDKPGSYVHRFSWLTDDLIGELPIEWNWLDTEYDYNDQAKIIHYTLGTPCFSEYKNSSMSKYWWEVYEISKNGIE
jgi:lipopolysaccharide biosynthesis glycosyltransferase